MSDDRSSLSDEQLADGLKGLGWVDEAEVERLRRSIVRLPERSSRTLVGQTLSRRRLGLIAAAVVVAVAVATLPLFDRSLLPASSSASATPVPSAPTPTPTRTVLPTASSTASPARHYVVGIVGFDRTLGWDWSTLGLTTSLDAGRTWQEVAMPPGLVAGAATSPSAVAGADGRAIWVAEAVGNDVEVVRLPTDPAASRSITRLTPHWTAPTDISGPPEALRVVSGPAGVVAVVVTIGIGTATAQNRMFISADDGRTFSERAAKGALEYLHSLAFVSETSGVLVQGAGTGEAVSVLRTADGGATWTAAGVPATTPGLVDFGAPTVVGSDLVLPMTTWAQANGVDQNAELRLLVSHDGGAIFQPIGVPLNLGSDWGATVTTLGSTTWVVGPAPQTAIRETADGGRTWTTVTPQGLPEGHFGVMLTGPDSAVAVAIDTSCSGFKTGCADTMWLVGTTDGGRTWTAL